MTKAYLDRLPPRAAISAHKMKEIPNRQQGAYANLMWREITRKDQIGINPFMRPIHTSLENATTM